MRNLLVLVICCFMWMPVLAQAAEQGKEAKESTPAHAHETGTVFRDCPTCPEMVIISTGSFEMGSPNSEDDRSNDEGPVRRVIVSTFAIGKTEITRGQFAAFIKDTKYAAGNHCRTLEGGKFEERNGRSWRDLGFLQNDNHPAACVNWNDAKAYTKWLSRKTGKPYRLPTEAEWEYAARGNTVTARYWGDNPDAACEYANVADKTAEATIQGALSWSAFNCTDGIAFTAPAGSFKANAFGLYDMLGNVWEWTEDNYHDNYSGAPSDSKAWEGVDTMRVLRGGSWNNSPSRVRSAKRGRDYPTSRFSNIGFRIARKLP
jgi:formylglycine-generating enzyme required for sulfatase activity